MQPLDLIHTVYIHTYIHKYAKSLQSCPTLCDPIDCSPPGSPVPGILQARTLEWVAISFCNAWKWKVKVKSLSRVRLLATPWTAALQAPLSMGFSRREHWSGRHRLLRTFCTWTHKDRMKALLLSFANFQPLEESFQLIGSQPLVRNSSLVRTLSLRVMRETYRSIWI